MKLNVFIKKLGVVGIFLLANLANGQDTIYVSKTIIQQVAEPKKEFPKFKIGGVFQARYLNSFKDGVDVEGLEHSSGDYVKNTYDIKRMRVSMNASLTKNLSVVTLVNFADFKSDTKTRVLENAFAQYAINNKLRLQVGQFRPAFGMEDSYAVDVVKSIDFSNLYYLNGNNGWQSFQIGAGINGVVNLDKIPFHYAITMTNGNGKNKLDNNNGKHYSGRFYFDLNKKNNFKLGLSAGVGDEFGETIYAVGFEASYTFHFTDKWSLEIQTEGAQASNQYLYFNTAESKRLGDFKDYVYKGIYVLPNLRYVIGKEHFQAVEFSMRYEYLDANYRLDSNPRQAWTPMLSLEFLKNYGARIQIGAQIDNYRKNIPNTKTYNSNLAFVQFQCRLQ